VMRYYKSIDVLIEAAKNLDAPILIIGSGDIIPHTNIPNVHFIGEVCEEDKVALLTLCYGVVLPSHLRSEAFGIFLLEGAMFGKPMICCDIGTGTTFINIDQETGLVVPPSDSAALSQAMQYLLDKPNEALRMGNNAQKRYERCFTADIMAKAYNEIYESLRTA
jgi:O-antigen biosynthesis rhamnosyltransferase